MSVPNAAPTQSPAQASFLCDRVNCENSNPTTLVCARCRHIRYCGRKCQREDWEQHKRHCANLLSGLLTHHFQRSPNLSDRQRRFLSTWPLDLTVQNLIPGNTSHEFSVPETLTIAAGTRGVILSHQPLNDRFRWSQNSTLCQYLTGQRQGYVEIYPSGYDYDITHTLYHVPESNPPRTVQTEDLTIDGVELIGITQLDLSSMAKFLEAAIGPARLSPRANITSITEQRLLDFIEPNMNRNNTNYMHARQPASLEPKEKREFERVRELRGIGLKLTSPKEDWIRECGVDWPEYFFGGKNEIKIEGNEEGINYGKGPKSDKAWEEYMKWMARQSGSG